MGADVLLSQLEKVKQTGPGRWIARCPTREDKSPSLSIREMDDGRVLLHDFGGSTPQEILAAVGLKFEDLFPERVIERGKPEHRPFPAADILRALSLEVLIVYMAGRTLAQGTALAERDQERLLLAVARIGASLEAGRLS
ncbi:DNA primase [Sulfuriferula sp.]|uniref:DNA primase n=1 Tax=Sulfuriferula sp. TaxID=2025307 RepID=UPI002731105B|nr:DNA primase [Sulfuriferula sp.]MDP2025873.1 DNA primase [Sulfuriferula sp.]